MGKVAPQNIFCIAIMLKCIANCDAIPGKLFPVYSWNKDIIWSSSSLQLSNDLFAQSYNYRDANQKSHSLLFISSFAS